MKIHESIWIAVLLTVETSCSKNLAASPTPTPFFPQQKETPNAFMDALLVGKLVLVDNCLRVNSHNLRESYLLIWPHDFSLHLHDEVMEIMDGNDQLVAREGDNLRLGGGEIPGRNVNEYTLQPLPDNCPGPYWIVGDEITRQ
jgi:hypothetical protein